jgi:hypothetical protein
MLKIPYPPDDLGSLVPAVSEGHDHMVVNLGEPVAVAGPQLDAMAVSLDDGLIYLRCLCFHPGEERRAKIEAYLSIVAHDVHDASLVVEDPRGGIRGIAFGGHPLVPIVIGVGGVLDLERFQPGIFPRRLIEMAMDAQISFHYSPSTEASL